VDDADGTVDFITLLVSDVRHLIISPYSAVGVEAGVKLLERSLRGLLKTDTPLG
jgi:hypothetical protein